MSDGSRLLRILLKVSEKAANIARVCRQNHTLFQLLVQEKYDDEKNPRFFQDFKTLADVLIQETVKHDIGAEFPELAKAVKGEESNVFGNTLGETVTVEVCSSSEEMTRLLAKVLDNDTETAKLLAMEVHRDIRLSDVPVGRDLPTEFDIATDDLGIWIDPIDSTADYINDKELVDDLTGVHLSGLRCVTILIGAYLRSTGLPVLGVINQPFYIHKSSQWTGICYWGLVSSKVRRCSLDGRFTTGKTVVLSRFEDANIKTMLLNGGYTLIEVPGAGYKVLTVATGQADAYILSKASTYQWDTCAPQALLRSLGGGIIDFKRFISNVDFDTVDLKYSTADTDFANRGGLIAYRDARILDSLKRVLSQ